MLLAYGKKFTDQWAGADADELLGYWGQQLAGFTGAELKRGLDGLEARDWPPTLPEFKRMCRPPVDPLKAYYEAVAGVTARFAGEHGKWSHPAIYWAAMPLATDLQQQTYSQVKPRWEASLEQQMAKGEWEEVPRPMLQLTAPEKARTREAAQKALERALSTLGRTPPSRQWAVEILERERAGDASLLPIQTQFAREAMRIEQPETISRASATTTTRRTHP